MAGGHLRASNLGHEDATVLLATQIQHALVHVVQVLLLRTEDRARPRDSDPANECCGWESEMFHTVETDQSASSTKAGFTVNSDCPSFVFSSCQELRYDLVRWRCSVLKLQIKELYSLFNELLFFILSSVEANNQGNS